MKKILLLLTTTTLILSCSFTAYADENGARGPGDQLPQTQIETTTKYVSANALNIRNEPSLDGDVIGTANLNDEIEIIEDVDGWSKILIDHSIAYIKSEYLSDVQVDSSHDYSWDDLYVLAHVICGEAQPYSDEEQLYVGSIVLNRVKHSEFPNSVSEVVFQKGQYACTRDGNYYREPTASNWANAQYLLEHGSILPDKVIWQSRSKQGKGVYLKTKYHYYCY